MKPRDFTYTQKTLDVPQKPAACLLSVRTVYTDECLGPGNLKMVQLARKVGGCVLGGGGLKETPSLVCLCPVSCSSARL